MNNFISDGDIIARIIIKNCSGIKRINLTVFETTNNISRNNCAYSGF